MDLKSLQYFQFDNFSSIFQFTKQDEKKEDFYTCCWTFDSITKRSILITTGVRGIIRILQPEINDWYENTKNLIGHGRAVNQLKVSPRLPYVLASASSDRSIRLWNIETEVCIATFHGEDAHRCEVLTVDLNRDFTKMSMIIIF